MKWIKKPNVQTITWTARSKTEFQTKTKPYPASQAVPDWWRNMTPYDVDASNPEGKKLIVRNRFSNATFKKCTPMLDAITSGYIIPLWADVQVTPEANNYPLITWRTFQPIFEIHGLSSKEVPPPPGYDNYVYKYLCGWIPKTPPGYSILATAPFGYRDLPFLSIPAIIDTDKDGLDLLFPMWIRKGFEGIVEAGTPMVQLTPFKRTDWKSEFNYLEDGQYLTVEEERTFNRTIVNHYVKNRWSKKTYK